MDKTNIDNNGTDNYDNKSDTHINVSMYKKKGNANMDDMDNMDNVNLDTGYKRIINKLYICDLCNSTFAHHTGLSRHKKCSCKYNPNKQIRSDKIKQIVKLENIKQQPSKDLITTDIPSAMGASSIDIKQDIPISGPNKISVENSIFPSLKENISEAFKEFGFKIEKTNPVPNRTIDLKSTNVSHKDTPLSHTNTGTSPTNTEIPSNDLITTLAEMMLKLETNIQTGIQSKMMDLKSTIAVSTKPNYYTNIEKGIFNIQKITMFMTDNIDFVDILTKRLGSRKHAIAYIKSKINQKIEGDVSLFCDIYLYGEPDTWPISCVDKKNKIFKIAQSDERVINDPGGMQIHKNFRNAYCNTLLRLSNEELQKTREMEGTLSYKSQLDDLMDVFDLRVFQDKAQSLYLTSCETFIRKLTVHFKRIEEGFKETFKLIDT